MPDSGLDVLHEIWEATTKLSDEAIEAARVKGEPLNLDKGAVTFNETRINLIHSRDVVADAVDNEKLVQLPISLQKSLLKLLDSIVEHLTAITNGTDEIILFVDEVDQLSVFLWNNGFYNLSSEVLGYQKKLNRLKAMELEASSLLDLLKSGEKTRDAVLDALKESEEAEKKIKSHAESAQEIKKQIDDTVNAISTSQQTV